MIAGFVLQSKIVQTEGSGHGENPPRASPIFDETKRTKSVGGRTKHYGLLCVCNTNRNSATKLCYRTLQKAYSSFLIKLWFVCLTLFFGSASPKDQRVRRNARLAARCCAEAQI